MIFFLQGSYVSEEEARLSVLDRGFLYGDGIYEMVRAAGGRLIFFKEHAQRLRRSAERLEIEIDEPAYDLGEILHELLRRNRLTEASMRVIVTRGVGGRDQLSGFCPTWIVTVEPFTPLPEETYRKGVAAVLVSIVRHDVASLNPEIKSCNLLNNVLARREAVRRSASEGILCNAAGFLAEGAFSNLFWITQEGTVRTPALSVGILPGVTRQKVLDLARRQGLAVEEVSARPCELDAAREIFLTSTSWEVLAVTTWNGRAVGNRLCGKVTGNLRDDLRRLYLQPEMGQ